MSEEKTNIKEVVNNEEEELKEKVVIHCSIGEKDFLSVPETMAYLNLKSTDTLRKWRDKGLDYMRVGGFVYYSKKDIAIFMEAHKVG